MTDPNEELVAEADVLRQELGGLVRELREFITRERENTSESWSVVGARNEILDAIEEIIDGG